MSQLFESKRNNNRNILGAGKVKPAQVWSLIYLPGAGWERGTQLFGILGENRPVYVHTHTPKKDTTYTLGGTTVGVHVHTNRAW